MQTLRLTQVAVFVRKLFGSLPANFKYDDFILCGELSEFHQIAKAAEITKGLELSRYRLSGYFGYSTTYLN